MVEQTGQGEVFRAEDVEDHVRAVKSVLGDAERYRRAYDTSGLLDEWTWEAQSERLDAVHSGLLPGSGSRPRAGRRTVEARS